MKVIIMRGLPGSGKSTWIANNVPGALVCSADEFMVQDGVYVWDPSKLHAAHSKCQDKYMLALQGRMPLVVVDNTNLRPRDMEYYVVLAENMGYDIEIRTIHCDPAVAAARNIHGVPPERYVALVDRLKRPLHPHWQEYEVVS